MGSKQNNRKGIFAVVASLWWLAQVLTALINAVKELAKKRQLTADEVDEKFLVLGKPEGEPVIDQIASLILGAAHGTVGLVKDAKYTILSYLGSGPFPAIGLFVAQEHFRISDSTSKVKISQMGKNFRAWFLVKTEVPISDRRIVYYKLLKTSADRNILAELDANNKVPSTLQMIWYLICHQKNGEIGSLLNDGKANVFFVKDVNNILRAVSVLWDAGGWQICARPIGDSMDWLEGRQIFSVNP